MTNKIKTWCLLVFTLLLQLAANADVIEIEGVYYNINEETKEAEVTSNPNKYTGNILIPESIISDGKTYSVTTIGDGAFLNCTNLTNVTVPINLTSIGIGSFRNCKSLKTISIPNSVKYIGGGAFTNCSSLTSINIPNGLSSISTTSFSGCSSLTSVNIPNNVKSIGKSAFGRCSNITEVYIPNSIISIDSTAFYGCSHLTSVHITDLAAWCNIEFGDILSNPLFYAMHLFVNEKEIEKLVIPESVTIIKKNTFARCNNISSIVIPSSVTSIEVCAFYMWWHLKDVFCYAKDVPLSSSNIFEDTYIESVTLYVPVSSLDKYRNTEPWRNFKHIIGIDSSEIFAVSADLKISDIFNLRGNKINNINKGLNIIRSNNGKTKKVIKKICDTL